MLDLITKMKNFFNKNSHHAIDDDSFEIEEEADSEEKNDIYLEWFDQFLNSSSYEKLTEEQKEHVDFILHCFDEYLIMLMQMIPQTGTQTTFVNFV